MPTLYTRFTSFYYSIKCCRTVAVLVGASDLLSIRLSMLGEKENWLRHCGRMSVSLGRITDNRLGACEKTKYSHV